MYVAAEHAPSRVFVYGQVGVVLHPPGPHGLDGAPSGGLVLNIFDNALVEVLGLLREPT